MDTKNKSRIVLFLFILTLLLGIVKTSKSDVYVGESISIISPTWDDDYIVTSEYETITMYIEWDSYGDIPGVNIYLYENNFQIKMLASETEDDGIYKWELTVEEKLFGDEFRIRVESSNDSSVSDMSSTFSIYAIEKFLNARTNVIMTRNGHEMTVWWNCTPDIEYVDIELYDGNDYVKSLKESLSTYWNSNYTWYINKGVEPSENYRIKVKATHDSTIYGFTDYFEIRRPLNYLPSYLIPLFIIISIVGIVAVIGGGIYYVRNKEAKKQRTKPEEDGMLEEKEKSQTQTNKIFCARCGSEIAADSQFCNSCGSEVK